MSEVREESPLVQAWRLDRSTRLPAVAGVRLGERAFLGHLNLRGDPGDERFLQAVAQCLELQLPLAPNTVTGSETLSALWLGPDEWLLVTPPDEQDELVPRLRENLQDVTSAVTDLSSGQTVITIAGRHARDVLAKGCTLDLHPRVFGSGRCAQTLLAKTGVLIRPCPEENFEVFVRRSFAASLWHWLEDAAGEYGFAVV